MKNLVAALAVSLLLACCLATNLAFGQSTRNNQPSTDIMERVRAKYTALKSYSDTGIVTVEYKGPDGPGPSTVEHRTFTTYYAAPRQFVFEFVKDPNDGGERYVVWVDGGDFFSWWSATKVREHYPKGQGGAAFAVATFPTEGSIMQISPLLFAEGGLHGPVVDLKVLKSDEVEEISKHRCYKVVGEVALAFGTGAVTAVRPTTVWIDTESLLVRKVFEDTPKNSSGTDRVTTTFEPVADPKIDDAKFKFNPPAGT